VKLHLAACCALSLLAIAGGADADQACSRRAQTWADVCSTRAHVEVEARRCPAEHIIFAVGTDEGQPLLVDVSTEPRGPRVIDGLGLSPMGDFADFRTAPKAEREAFERLAACVQSDSQLPFGPASAADSAPGSGGPTLPLRLTTALVVGLVVSALELGRRRYVRRRLLGRPRP
jgi:hypothetical protein